MKLITDNATLLRYVPNVLATAQGEAELFTKIQPQLALAEQWVQDTFTDEAILTMLAAEDETNPTRRVADLIIVCEALRRAAPQLDLVLTPNGFGIVSNSNIAPASKERVERLITTLVETRDKAISALLLDLAEDAIWSSTEQAAFFRGTLFPDLSVCDALGIHTDRWANYLALRPCLQVIENDIAREFLSPEVLSALRLGNFPDLAARLRPLILARYQSLPPRFAEDASIVQFIRATPDLYALWSSTEIGERWEKPIVFENKQSNKGYWF